MLLPRFSSLSTRFGITFLAYVLVGSALLLGWLWQREQRQSAAVFATLASADADFIREMRLPRSARLAEDVGRLLKMQVYFRDQARSLIPVPAEALLVPLADLPVSRPPFRVNDNEEAIALRLDALHDVVFVRDTPSSISSLQQPENWAALGAFALLSLGLALGLSRTVVRPIQALTQRLPGFFDAAATLPANHASNPLPESLRHDEIGQLACALGDARSQLARERERRANSERLALLSRMATGLAHEIKNPVAGITMHAQLLASSPLDAHAAEGLQHILASASEVDGLVNQWLFLARPSPPAMTTLDLREVLQQTLNALTSQAQHAQVELVAELPEEVLLWIKGDRARLGQVLRNLILNAVQAMSRSGGTLRIGAAMAGDARAPLLRLSFFDSGPGFTPDALAHAQDLFFSEREGGMGVGLSVATEIIAAHDGTLHLANTEPHGACVTLLLPQAPSP